jgi:hypothetical protein
MTATRSYVRQKVRALVRRSRYLSSGTLKRVDMRFITNEFAFSFAGEGWNYFRALVAEYERRPQLKLEDSVFHRFFQHERVKSVRYLNDLLFLHQPEKRDCGFQFALGTYPWGDHVGGGPWGRHFDRVESKSTRDLYGPSANIWYEPGDPRAMQLEWEQTIRAYQAIRQGYHPLRSGQLPEVTLLIRRNGETRAVRYNGQHRLAVLGHLERQRLTVLVPSARSVNASLETWPSVSRLPKVVHDGEIVVREDDVEHWPYVARGLCPREQALEIFHAFFEMNGRERVNFLGIPSVY